jgi:plastocyanin
MYQDSVNGTEHGIHALPPTGGNDTRFGTGNYQLITPDSSRIAYTRFVTVENHSELFSEQIFGGDQRNLSGLGGTGFVSDVRVSDDNEWFVFLAQFNGRYDLRVSDGAEAQPPILPPTVITGLAAANNGPKEVGVPISFMTSISSGTEISYTWDYGDSKGGGGIASSHVYTQAGVYSATVVANNATSTMTATTVVLVGDAVVEVSNNRYTPQEVTIGPGGTVIWVLKAGTHSVTADDGSFNQPADNDWLPFAHTFASTAFTNATTIPYHCTVHGAGMSGTVIILGEEEQTKVKLLLPDLGKE